MSDEAALLAAILAHPDEDTPRLMYADWLQENGQPERAEFIRIQCAPDADEAAEERAAELEERNRAKWLAGLPQFSEARWEFRRGFPEYLECSDELMLERYEAFARVPWLRSVSLYDLDNSSARDFANRRWNPQWVELGLWVEFQLREDTAGQVVIVIANCPQVEQLRRLELFMMHAGPDVVAALAESPHLGNLQHLQLNGNRDDPRFAPLRERFGDRFVIV